MKKHKSALGKIVDMAALAAKNEKVRAVGNMKVNARGDTIDGHGRVIVPVTQKVNDAYAKTVNNTSAQVAKSNQTPNRPKQELTVEEQMIEDSFEEDLEIEKIKSKESKK
jgi:hypothetical protein